jgi:DNA polymerase-3 subunit beta
MRESDHPSLGHAIEKVPIEYDDEEFEIGFNAKYLIDTFSVLNSGEVILEFNNVYKPVIIRSPLLPDFLGIIMPLKL